MSTKQTDSQGLTFYSRLVLFGLVLPLLFIAGVQLFVLSRQTATYFAWTFASPLPAAFMGAGYWAAIFHAYTGARAKGWQFVRTSMPAALTVLASRQIPSQRPPLHHTLCHLGMDCCLCAGATHSRRRVDHSSPIARCQCQGTKSASSLDERRIRLTSFVRAVIWSWSIPFSNHPLHPLAMDGHTVSGSCS